VVVRYMPGGSIHAHTPEARAEAVPAD